MERWKNPFRKGPIIPNISKEDRVMETLDYPFRDEVNDKTHKKMNILLLISLILMLGSLVLLKTLGISIVFSNS